jgi:aminopeptidase N
MKKARLFFAFQLFGVLPFFCYAQGSSAGLDEKGVQESLAAYRHKILSGVHYLLHFTIPAAKEEKIPATETISFDLKKVAVLPVDFKDSVNHLQSIEVNGKQVAIDYHDEHIFIAPKMLRAGRNTITIVFTAGELSLNRNNEYLYTLLVPDRARTLFPCFDQPDIKSRFQLKLTIPQQWDALGNGMLMSTSMKNGTKTYSYKASDLFSTYLFSFAAGKFHRAKSPKNLGPFNFYYRETDSTKIHLSIDTIFRLHQSSINFLEAYTQIKFPFQKLDFVAIPDFQYGGMEHVGAIDYKASALFLDAGATRDQENGRANLIAHETSHMWFGDLVTMKWFNDVWMKEVFANFMADKITKGGSNYELKFLLAHFPRAYAVDRTEGANPIRQPLNNLQEAGTLYGAIIYDKAPVMMRQLERLMGALAFRDGLRTYLKRYSFANATWPDLIRILDQRTPADLEAWNTVWVNTPGRPVITYEMQEQTGKIKKLTLFQKGERIDGYILPQFFEIALVYPDTIQQVTVNMNRAQVEVKELEGRPVPTYLFFNSSGQGYGLFPLDEKARPITLLKDPVMRASSYLNQYENMLSGNYMKPLELFTNLLGLLPYEAEELNLSMMAGQITDIYWRLIPADMRKGIAATVEKSLWQYLALKQTANRKKILFRAFQNIALTNNALDTLYAIWKDKSPPAGVTLSEDEYISLALNLSVKDYPDARLLDHQLERTMDPDRRLRLKFLMPAVSGNVSVRDSFFNALKIQQVRKKESWVADALSYLHHPLRTGSSQKYLTESLEMLEEIQRTGDIFFPGTWLNTSFGSYTSPEAVAIVRNFLSAHPDYNPKLKAKILQAADPLFRAERLLSQ